MDFDKPDGFMGQAALLAAKDDPDHLKTRIVQLVLDDDAAQLWGGEAVLCNGREIGEVRSAAFGHTLGPTATLCQVDAPERVTEDFNRNNSFEIDIAGTRYAANAHLRTPYDAKRSGEKPTDKHGCRISKTERTNVFMRCQKSYSNRQILRRAVNAEAFRLTK